MKPMILTVDDDPQILMEILKQLELRNEPPALFLVD